MHKVYDMWPEIARKSYEQNFVKADFDGIEHIIFAGMGGSGALGDIFASILSKTKIHVDVVKGYLLPETVDSNTLVIVVSISGNTEETLNVLKLASKLNCKLIAFSSGGKMKRYCTKYNIEFREIKQIHSPRVSFTNFLYSMLKILESVIPVKHEDILESLTELESLRDKISSNNLTQENPSLNLAMWISGTPLIYYPHGLQAAAIRFKNSLQENGKIHTISEDVIEACHNGIVPWEKHSNVQPILLEGNNDYVKTKERWEILKKYFNINKIDYYEIHSVKGSILSKLINLIYLLDYSSIFYAVISKTDPSPVKSIDFIKKSISE
ncbi:glucose-6-phosphate isomerase [Nitrosopumilus sp. b3]|nr:glucose-6-phosphate isomerase [Nitrosopumilus sp. b3]